METPFFSNRICVGNAVVGAWLKVYKVNDIAQELDKNGRPLSKQPKKEWWESAPRQLEFKAQTDYTKIKHGRKPDEIYHFLLPDKNMVPSAGIKMLKEESPEFARGVAEWKKDWIKPLNKSETEKLQLLSNKIDELLTEYYQFQLTIASQTRTRQNIFGATKANEQFQISMRSYDEKERLADQRNRHSAPYFKLKMVMDYWCSLWFWDVRDAVQLPNRNQYWNDIASILQLDTNAAVDGIIVKRGQQSLYESPSQLTMVMDSAGETLEPSTGNAASDFVDAVVEYTNRKDLFDNNQRLSLVSQLAKKYFFFHSQLEFLEVFWERGGFDLIAGNPPWLKITFEEKGIIAEQFPEVEIKNLTAPQVRLLQAKFFKDEKLKELYFDEILGTESTSVFMNVGQNYPLLRGQQTNLYKCVLENGFSLLSKNGLMGLLHPEGVYDDPNGQRFRKEIYSKLKYHFQFVNTLKLFSEILHWVKYSVNIYKGNSESSKINFVSISNLYHPSTIDASLIHDGNGTCGGLKIKELGSGKYNWNLLPHKNRIINITLKELEIISKVIQDEINTTRLISIHSSELLNVLEIFSNDSKKLNDGFLNNLSSGWHETNDVNNNFILRRVSYPNDNLKDFVLSGPHFNGNDIFYKNPHEFNNDKSHYDVINKTITPYDFWPRSIYKTLNFDIAKSIFGKDYDKKFRLIITSQLSQPRERTLQAVIIPPNITHLGTVISLTFISEMDLIIFCGFLNSLVYDFYIKTLAKGSIYSNDVKSLPFPVNRNYSKYIISRVLILNCLSNQYHDLWERNWDDSFLNENWSKIDERLTKFNLLKRHISFNPDFRNFYLRRQLEVEIDVLTAMTLGLSLDHLLLIYDVQFPVLQQNEDDTWYDTKGNIVFTCSKGLVGVGLDRKEWEQVRNLPAGETYEHTITKSELYQGKKITYYAPFDKCVRVEDYKLAWEHFEEIFK